KEIRQGALQPRSPALVYGEPRAGNPRSRFQVQDTRVFPNLPVRLWLKIEFPRSAPAAHLLVVLGAMTRRHAGMRNVRNGEQQFALSGVQFGDALVGLLDALGKLLHLREDGVRALLFFFEPRDFVAGFIAL